MATARRIIKNYKDDFIVDAPFLISREKTLTKKPRKDSETIFLNGLSIPDDCYTIVGDLLTFAGGVDLKLVDDIFVRYSS